jgi:hypothetical protein
MVPGSPQGIFAFVLQCWSLVISLSLLSYKTFSFIYFDFNKCQGESLRERVKSMGQGPPRCLRRGQVPSPPLPPSPKGVWGETQAGEGTGPQSVGVVLGAKNYGEQEPLPGIMGVVGKAQGLFVRIHHFLIPN